MKIFRGPLKIRYVDSECKNDVVHGLVSGASVARPFISMSAVAVLLVFGNAASSQPASQTPPTWVMSKDPVICTSSDLMGPFDPISKGHFSACDFSSLTC